MKLSRSILFSVVLFVWGQGALAVTEGFNTSEQGVMLHGYDTVAYFQGKPAQGSTEHSARYKGERYLFASAENRSEFLWHPEKYSPAFGGYCAYGVRMGKKFDIDPEAYEIVGGKLFVMLNRATQALWKQDVKVNIDIARQNWPVIVDISPEQL